MSDDLTVLIIKSRYKLIEKLEEDTLAVKYIVRDIESNIIYIMKILHSELAGDQRLLIRFQREAHIHVNNQHCIRVIDYGTDHHLYYIVMEYIDGQNLKYHIVKYGPMEPLRALNYAQQIAEGLEAVNRLGIVHRDIKPQKVFITRKEVVKISDFDTARSVEDSAITSTNEYIGTPFYMAPEQVYHAHSADIRSDLYSLGIVLFELLVGYPPYTGGTVDVILKHQSEEIPSICRLHRGLPSEMDAFMYKAMAKFFLMIRRPPREFIGALIQLQQLIKTILPQKPVTPNRSQEAFDDTVYRIRKSSQKQARIVVINSGQSVPVTQELMVVGRQDLTLGIFPEIPLNDKTVGRRHANLHNQQGHFTVEDLNSLNKTRLNGRILIPYQETPLKDGDILRFGNVEARFELL